MVTQIISSVYQHIQLSHTRLQAFKDIAELLELLEVDCLKFKTLFEIRWLSIGKCIQALLRNYEPLMILLSQEADKGNPTSVGLLQQMTS